MVVCVCVCALLRNTPCTPYSFFFFFLCFFDFQTDSHSFFFLGYTKLVDPFPTDGGALPALK